MILQSTIQKQAPLKCTFDAFDTIVSFQAYLDERDAADVVSFLKGECARYEQLFSAFKEDSDVGRMNAARGEWARISPETCELLETSLEYCRLSRGAFDITVKPLIDLWDVHRGIVPAEGDIEEALSHVDFRMVEVELRGDGPYARLGDPDAAIDLGGTAKGYIADRLCQMLVDRGVESFLVSLGGNVATRGVKPDGSPFVVGVRDPNDHGKVLGTLELRDASAVASGVTERYFEADGVAYSHIIDPRTGYPVTTDMKSATLVAQRSADCDGFSTTMCMLGMRGATRFFEDIDQLDMAVLAGADGTVETCWRRGPRMRAVSR